MSADYDTAALRRDIIAAANRLGPSGLSHGKTGNVSARCDGGFLVTPTGMPYPRLTPDSIVEVGMDGTPAPGSLVPSSEWRFHRDIYREKNDVDAIVHAHSPFATALACANLEIPAFHYMVAVAGGDNIPLAPYATFGSQELSEHVVAALALRRACLLANHGMIATGPTLDAAYELATTVEELARHYWLTLQLGTPTVLTHEQMRSVHERFRPHWPGRSNCAL